MKVVVFGATGPTGREIIRQCLDRGISCSAFVRNARALGKIDGLTVYEGDATNFADVSQAVQGHGAVISALGGRSRRKNKARSLGTKNIIEAMEAQGLHRFVSLSSIGVGESRMMPPWVVRTFFINLIAVYAFRDHEEQERLIKASSLDWTIVQPTFLTNGKHTGRCTHGFSLSKPDAGLKTSVSRADVAQFMIEQLEDETYVRRTVGVTGGGRVGQTQ